LAQTHRAFPDMTGNTYSEFAHGRTWDKGSQKRFGVKFEESD
jgi:hypothetical protein